jgi:hypothetical protein
MRVLRIVLAVSGASVAAIGAAGIARHAGQTQPNEWLKFLVGGLLAHDFVLAPITAATGWLLVRRVPASVRPAVMAGLFVSASLALVAIPVVGGYGRLANNPSILPSHHYARALIASVAVVWLVTAVAARRRARALRRPRGG